MGKQGETSEDFEFFGPYVGPTAMVVFLPLVVHLLYMACNEHDCLTLSPLHIPEMSLSIITKSFTLRGFAVVLGYLGFMLFLHFALPARLVEGTKLPDGSRLTYRVNAQLCFFVTYGLALLAAAHSIWNPAATVLNLGWVAEHFAELATATIVICFALAACLYATSFRPGAMLCHGARGYFIYDFFMGRELNPRLGQLDLKEWCELYPGLTAWAVLNLCMLVRQYQRSSQVTASMLLVNAFQLLYVYDAYSNEPAILTTMDITTDGFGFMLAFGDLAWVPFTYSTQARFLAFNPVPLGRIAIAAIVALKVLGYVTFRGSNSQKDAFRRDPNSPKVKHLRTLETARGTKLIVSGWWGVARHINYTGDWLMGLAWCLPTGFATPVTYFYAAYFLALLLHRDMRDYQSCKAKYGKDWDKYCSIVKYSMFPYIY